MTSFLVPYLLLVLNHLNINGHPMNEFKLPTTWAKDFTITYSRSGGMDGSSTKITITHDSCSYQYQSAVKAPFTSAHAITEADRVAILKKMHELKVNTIKYEISIHPVDDGWSELVCFGRHCLQGGPSVKMSDKHEEIFSAACNYLQTFATKHSDKK